MPHATGPDTAVEVRGKLRMRFYEPIILLLALNEGWKHNLAPKVLGREPDGNAHSKEQLFRDFMNKLAQICDNKPKGTTVTAIAALQYPDGVEYRLASNERSERDLNCLKGFIEDILDSLKPWTVENNGEVRAIILRKIVAFNRPRLQAYVRAIQSQSQECLDLPAESVTTQVRETLNRLQSLSNKAIEKDASEAAFFTSCTHLAAYIRKLSSSEIYAIYRDKALKENSQESPWGKLRHAAGRLMSYYGAAYILVQARRRWECLFHEFRVKCLPSSTALSNPITRKKVTGSDIIGRMTSDQGKAAGYKHKLQDLQASFDVDGHIKEKVDAKKFQPIVHAEVLLHHSITNDPHPYIRNLHPSMFFDGNIYIGSSKPTCRLCHYYISACADSIQTRESHKNVYYRWRLPDVYKNQGEDAVKHREDLLNKMLVWIREDTFRTLTDKVPEREPNDSNTGPYNNPGTSLGSYVEGSLECVSEGFGRLKLGIKGTVRDAHGDLSDGKAGLTESDDYEDLSDGKGGLTESDDHEELSDGKEDSTEFVSQDDDDDDDGGGALL